MKNKILASLLAVCLFAGLAVPAFAANVSSQSGVDTDVKTTSFVKDSYTVKNGKTEDMAKQFRAYVSNKQLVQDPTVEWSIENDDKFAFNISDEGVVSAVEDAGTATVVATVNIDGKDIVAKTKVIAAKADAVIKATGFQFTDNKITAKTGFSVAASGKATQDFEIVAYPKDAKFTDAQITAIVTDFNTNKAAFAIGGVTPAAVAGDNKVVVSYDNGTVVNPIYEAEITATTGTITIDGVSMAATGTPATDAASFITLYNGADGKATGRSFVATAATTKVTLTAKDGTGFTAPKATGATVTTKTPASSASGLSAYSKDVDAKVVQLEVTFPNYNDAVKTSKVRRSVTTSAKIAAPATAINAAGTVTLEVGETATVKKYFKQGPSSANITFDQSVMQGYSDQNAQYDDYAVLTGGDDYEIIGVAVGSNKIVCQITLPTGEVKEAGLLVKVVEKGTKPAASGTVTTVLSAWAPKLGVGETANVVVKADKAVTYTSLDTAIVTVDAAGKLTAVKEGTAKVKVQEEGKDAVYLTVTVAAATTKPSDKPSDVPQTAVVALAPLF